MWGKKDTKRSRIEVENMTKLKRERKLVKSGENGIKTDNRVNYKEE